MHDHWSDLLMADHEQTEKVIDALETLWRDQAPDPVMVAKAVRYFSEFADACHNQKEEQHLFPLLEAAGIPRQGGPLAVMLAEHERSQELLEAFRALGQRVAGRRRGRGREMLRVFREYGALLKGHYWKENDILYPMGRRALGPQDDAAIVAGIEALEAGLGADTRARYQALAREITQGRSTTCPPRSTASVLAAILNTLPVELSFVDADDSVRYFSHENQAKIFPRTRGVIGMKVQNCHPPKSLHMVEQILADFKAGRRQGAEFWIDMAGREGAHPLLPGARRRRATTSAAWRRCRTSPPSSSSSGQKRLLD